MTNAAHFPSPVVCWRERVAGRNGEKSHGDRSPSDDRSDAGRLG